MSNKELLERKDKLLEEIRKIDGELNKQTYINLNKTVKVINFRGAMIGAGEDIGDYEMFDVLWKLTDKEYNDLINSTKNNIYELLNNIINNHDNNHYLKHLKIINDLNYYDILYFDKDKTCFCYPCELYVCLGIKYGDEIYDGINISLKLLNVPVEVYNEFKNVCIRRCPLDPDL